MFDPLVLGPRRVLRSVACAGVLVTSLLAAAPATATLSGPNQQFVLGAENNRLNAYDAVTLKKHTIDYSEADRPGVGLDINAQICTIPDSVPWKPKDETWIIAGEDTEQNAQPGIIRQGWGIFHLTGTSLDTLAMTEVGKLVPDSFVTKADNPENYGCGFLPDGRLLTGDVGDQQPESPATGQLIEWFPDASMFTGSIGPTRTDFKRVPHCKIDVAIGTSGGILTEGNTVYIAANRPDLQTLTLGGIYRYDSTIWPKGETPADGCSAVDATAKHMAAPNHVGKSVFITQGPFALTPSDIVASGHGSYYVSSVFSGTISEFDRSGSFVRTVLVSPGQVGQPGVLPQLNGITPLGIGVADDGALWIADIGVVGNEPAAAAGSEVRLPIAADGTIGNPQVVDQGLEFPDGIGFVGIPHQKIAPAVTVTVCNSRRIVTFRLPKGARKVALTVAGKPRKTSLRGRTLRLPLNGLPKGAVRVRITAQVHGRRYTRTTTLHPCVNRPGAPA